MITNGTIIVWFDSHSSKRRNSNVFPESYIKVSDTFAIIELIAETTLKFITNTRYNIFGYGVFGPERIGKNLLDI